MSGPSEFSNRRGVGGAVLNAFAEMIRENADEETRIAISWLQPEEKILGLQMGEKRLPFLLRIVPFMPDVITAPRSFLLVVTNQRFLSIELKKSLLTRRLKKSVQAASVPLAQLRDVIPATGRMTSSVAIYSTTGLCLQYTGLLKSAAETLARSIHAARQIGGHVSQ